MRTEKSAWTGAWHTLALLCTVALGVMTIVGSGGGGYVGGCPAAGPCEGDFPAEPAAPTIEPLNATVQVGATVVFSASAPGIGNPVFRWFRVSAVGQVTAIAGVTTAAYTLAGAQLVDDNTSYYAVTTGSIGGRPVTVVSKLRAALAVSSMPGVSFEDSEFQLADWSASALSEPAANGPAHSQERSTAGGNPGAYRRTQIVLPTGPTKLHLFDTFHNAYDPALQGAVYRVDFKLDCLALPGILGVGPTLLIEQSGRRYTAGAPAACGSAAWSEARHPVGFGATDFLRVDGPACGTGLACPDFSAAGAPIRFGFANRNEGLAGFVGATGGFGADNWKVTVWRR